MKEEISHAKPANLAKEDGVKEEISHAKPAKEELCERRNISRKARKGRGGRNFSRKGAKKEISIDCILIK